LGLEGVRVAVLGAGRMGSAIIRGLVAAGAEVIATGRRRETLERAAALGARTTRSNTEAVDEADIVVIAVKPFNYPEVAEEIAGHVAGKVVASIMAGVTLKILDKTLPGAETYRAMPNIGALVGRSVTALALRDGGGRGSNWRLVEEVFKTIGSVVWIPESLMDAWTALAGSGPGILAEIIDAMILGGVAAGLRRDVATKAVAEQLRAIADLLEEKHPAAIRDEVATPGGTTIAGIHALSSYSPRRMLMDAILAAAEKSRELSEYVANELAKKLNID